MQDRVTQEPGDRRALLINLRHFNYAQLGEAVARELDACLGTDVVFRPDADQQFGAYLNRSRLAQLWSETQRRGQQLMWEWAENAAAAAAAQVLAELQDDDPLLELTPELEMPSYYDGVEFHIQPGGYQVPLSGAVYDTMVPMFYMGRMAVDHYARLLCEQREASPPRDILDLGAGVGHNTLRWAEAFPAAKVHAIDLSAPMLRWGRHLARSRGLAVYWKQMNAEALAYADRSFDVVSACILWHELPEGAIRAACREARRVLRPGGVLLVADHVPLAATATSFQAFHRWWDTRYNGEPFVLDFVRLDLTRIAREAGFSSVEERLIGKPSGHAGSGVARVLAATA